MKKLNPYLAGKFCLDCHLPMNFNIHGNVLCHCCFKARKDKAREAAGIPKRPTILDRFLAANPHIDADAFRAKRKCC